MNEHTNSQSGWTLAEIAILITVVTVIAFIALPALKRKHDGDALSTCISNLRMIDGAVQTWSLEFKKDDNSPVTFTDVGGYLRRTELIYCPAAEAPDRILQRSYAVTIVSANPTCRIAPAIHSLPEHTAN